MIARSIAHRSDFRFRLHAADLPGKPDLVFRSRHAVVFVHGCSRRVHTRKRGHGTPTTNTAFGRARREANRARDRRTPAAPRRARRRVFIVRER